MDEVFVNPNDVKLKRTVVFRGDQDQVRERITRGANWILWIVGISVVNTVMILFGSDSFFNLGLGATFIVDLLFKHVIQDSENHARLILQGMNIGIDGVVYAIFLGLWHLTVRRFAKWGLITAMILFTLDSLIFVGVGEWIPVAIHAVALFSMSGALIAFKDVEIKRL